MEVLTYHLGWLAALTHSYKIAPPPLIGTMAAVPGAINWIVGKLNKVYQNKDLRHCHFLTAKGLGSFVAGQLIDKNPTDNRASFPTLGWNLFSRSHCFLHHLPHSWTAPALAILNVV